MLLTVVIPVASYHAGTVHETVASVTSQTLPCRVVVIEDTARRGAGWARNQGLKQVETPFVTFLDADDWLEPDFAEQTLAYRTPKTYVYTDWRQDGNGVEAPDKPWCDGRWHIVTTLLPTSWAVGVGGFDETLPGAEDTDFYAKLTRTGLRPLHLNQPLVHYRKGGQRGQTFVTGSDYLPTMELIRKRYEVYMACCGDEEGMSIPPVGEKRDGDVLAMALWAGNRQERGRISGRIYPRTGNGRTVWVNPADAQIRPDLWRIIPDEPAYEAPQVTIVTPKKENRTNIPPRTAQGAVGLGQMVFGNPAVVEPVKVQPAAVAPDFRRVIDTARRNME